MHDITDGLSMEELRGRIDHLEALVKESEGDPDRTGQFWDELKHLRQVYDRMIMDSQGRGIQMMNDIMDKSPETRENYVAGVPVPSTEAPAGLNKPSQSVVPVAGVGVPPNVSLTVNIVKQEEAGMERSLDARAAELAKSDIGDVRIPLNMQASILKARKDKAEKKSSVDGIDQDKIREAKKKLSEKEQSDEDEDEGEDEGEQKKSYEENFFKSQTETLQKSVLAKSAKLLFVCGKWAFDRIHAQDVSCDNIAKSMRMTIEKAAGATVVGGVKAPSGAPKAAAHARIVGLNAEIQTLQERISACTDPEMQVKYDRYLRSLMEELAVAVMSSEGMGLKTEDMVPENSKKVDVQPGSPVLPVAKSQSQDLEKSRHFTGKVGGLKYALTIWDAQGGLKKEQAHAIVQRVASTDKAVAKRLKSKLPPLPKGKEKGCYIHADSDNGGGEKGGSKSVKHDHQGGQKKAHSDRRVGSAGHPGKHAGQMKHIISGGGKAKGKK